MKEFANKHPILTYCLVIYLIDAVVDIFKKKEDSNNDSSVSD